MRKYCHRESIDYLEDSPTKLIKMKSEWFHTKRSHSKRKSKMNLEIFEEAEAEILADPTLLKKGKSILPCSDYRLTPTRLPLYHSKSVSI